MKAIKKNLGQAYYADSASPRNLSGPVSKSLLWKFHKSPHKWFKGSGTFTPTASMQLGSLFHAAILQPHLIGTEYITSMFSDFRTNAAKDWRDEQAANGVSVVSQSDMDKALAAAEVFRDHHDIIDLNTCETEVAAYANFGNCQLKCMVDIVPNSGNSLWDLKTTASIDDADSLIRTILNFGYHWQAAMYLDIWNMATGENRDEFIFVFMETTAPYETAIVKLDRDFLDHGKYGYMNALHRWHYCVQHSHFPEAVEGIQTLSLPKWAK